MRVRIRTRPQRLVTLTNVRTHIHIRVENTYNFAEFHFSCSYDQKQGKAANSERYLPPTEFLYLYPVALIKSAQDNKPQLQSNGHFSTFESSILTTIHNSIYLLFVFPTQIVRRRYDYNNRLVGSVGLE